jgi:hypothetical protein
LGGWSSFPEFSLHLRQSVFIRVIRVQIKSHRSRLAA